MVKKNACVFISGTGTNLKALIKSSRNYNFPINIKYIASNTKKANGLRFARLYKIPYLLIIKQKPIPQLNVFNISLSLILLDFKNLKIFFILIFDKSIFSVRLSGTDLKRLSTNPPPVICAAL